MLVRRASFNFTPEKIDEPWIGFIHNPPRHPEHIREWYHGIADAETLLKSKTWRRNARTCVGLFCLSKYLYDFVTTRTDVPLAWTWHPTETPEQKFTWERFQQNSDPKIVLPGHWLRDFQAICDLQSPYPKYILKGSLLDYKKMERTLDQTDRQPVGTLPRLTNKDYDQLFTENLVFLPLFDSSANNSVIECIVRNTPILVSRLPATQEYLGESYPLFFDTLEEASVKLANQSLIRDAYQYLAQMNKDYLKGTNFLQAIKQSHIYQQREKRAKAVPLRLLIKT
jgi:hypothetical protein